MSVSILLTCPTNNISGSVSLLLLLPHCLHVSLPTTLTYYIRNLLSFPPPTRAPKASRSSLPTRLPHCLLSTLHTTASLLPMPVHTPKHTLKAVLRASCGAIYVGSGLSYFRELRHTEMRTSVVMQQSVRFLYTIYKLLKKMSSFWL